MAGRRTAVLAGLALASLTAAPALAHTAPLHPIASTAAAAALHADLDGDGLDDVFATRFPKHPADCDYIVYSSGIANVCPTPYPDRTGDPQMLATATGDFNADGYDDLAMGESDAGAPRGQYNAGRVQVYYGGPTGLAGSLYQEFDHRTPGIVGVDPRASGFGAALAIGDVNGDGDADLVIGVSGDFAGGVKGAGSVVVLFGSPTGLTAAHSVRFGQAHAGVPGRPSRYAGFGGAVAAVDVTGDGYADVAAADEGHSGYVSMLRGSASGVSFTGASFVDTYSTYAPEEDLLTGGDVNGDGYADLVGASPREYPGGALLEMLGGPDGISQRRATTFNEDSPGVPRAPLPPDFWGSSIAVGDVNGDGYDDLLAGAPGKTVAGVDSAGIVIMLPGTASGLTGHGSVAWDENTPGFCDSPGDSDWFGDAVMIGHFADTVRFDAIISAPFDEGSTGAFEAGLLTWVTGGSTPTPGQCVDDEGRWLGFEMIGPRQNA